jgi:hypothetical protein
MASAFWAAARADGVAAEGFATAGADSGARTSKLKAIILVMGFILSPRYSVTE